MYTPTHLLTRYDKKENDQTRERWSTKRGMQDKLYVIEKIKDGAGEDFLEWDVDSGKLPTIEDYHDLRGIDLWKLDIEFPSGDSFEGIDFSYSKMWHFTWKNACFPETTCNFARLYNITLEQCLFSFSYWYGTTFEKVRFVECDFVQHDMFNNCQFIDCSFENCFFSENVFVDCKFDSRTTINVGKESPNGNFKVKLDRKEQPAIFKGIKDAYMSGEVYPMYRRFFFNQKKSEREELLTGLDKYNALINELFTGYGTKWQNTVYVSLVVVLLFAMVYMLAFNVDFLGALKLSGSSFVSLGDTTTMNGIQSTLYLIETGIGIGMLALFVTVLANIWFTER